MSKITTTYTTIIHSVLRNTNLSLTEYAVCDIIDKLSNREGWPWCNMELNAIAEILCVDEKTIGRAVKKLRDLGYVEGTRNKKRTTNKWVFDTTNSPIVKDNLEKITDNLSPLYNDNKDINIVAPVTQVAKSSLPRDFGDSPVKRLTTLYKKMVETNTGITPVLNYGKVGGILKSLLSKMPELDVAMYLMAHCNYNSDKDKFLGDRLKNQMYPIELLAVNINIYKRYIEQDNGVDMTDEESVKDIINNYIETL